MSDTITSRTGARFDRVAEQWDENPERVFMAGRFAAAISATLSLHDDMTALEFGCGSGNLSLALAAKLGRITAIDASAGMVEVLRRKLASGGVTNITAEQGDVGGTLPGADFDLIYSAMVLHHLPDVPGVIARLANALKPGGMLVLIDLEPEDGSFHNDDTLIFHHGFAREVLESWLIGAGLEMVGWRNGIHRREKTFPDGSVRIYPMFLAAARRPV